MTIFSLMKMAESSPKWIENTVGKGEIAIGTLILYHTIRLLKNLKRVPSVNILRKGENAGNLSFKFILSSGTVFNLDWSKIFSFGNKLKHHKGFHRRQMNCGSYDVRFDSRRVENHLK